MDVLLSRLSRRKQLMVELFGLIVFLMPVAVLVLEQPPTSSNTALAQAREVRFMMLPASHRAARRAGSDAGEAPETASDGSPTRAAERSR